MEALKINLGDPTITISTRQGLTDRQIDIRARKYADLDAQIKALTAERDAIRAELIEEGTRQTKNYVLTVTTSTRSGIDAARLKKERPKIYAEYAKQTEQTRFTVRAI